MGSAAAKLSRQPGVLAEFPGNGLRRWARGGAVLPIPGLTTAASHPSSNAPGRVGRADDAALRALVVRVREGDVAAFSQLYKLTRDEVARSLFHLVGQRADLEDLLQETFLRLLSAVKSFRGESQFRTFLYRICANVAFSHLRWKRRRPEDPVSSLPEQISLSADPESEASRRQAAMLVQKALEALTPKKRVVFVYHELLGMGPEEIAAAVGSSPNTVRSRLHHARREFAASMRKVLAVRMPVAEPATADLVTAIKAQGGLDGAA